MTDIQLHYAGRIRLLRTNVNIQVNSE